MKILMLNGARKLIGEAAHALDLTEELNRCGHDTQLVLRSNCVLLDIARARNMPIALTLRNGGGFHPIHSIGEFWNLRRLIMNFRPDVVHCHRGNDHGLAVAVIKTLPRSRMPAIVRTRHRVVPVKNTIANRWLFVRNTHGVISVSARAAQSFGLMMPMLAHKMAVVYSSVDIENFNPARRSAIWREAHGVADDEPLIGLIARLQRVKGQRQFLLAAARVLEKFPRAKFLVAGSGPDSWRERLCRFVNDLGIAENVIFKDWLDDIHAVTASLDIGVLASLGSEASSRVVYEYMSSGVPVVATAVGCIPELLSESQMGLVVPPGDPVAMAEAICSALQSPQMRAELSQRARAHVELNHNRQRWVTDMLDAYEKAIQRRNGEIPQSPGIGSYRLVLTGRIEEDLKRNDLTV